MTRNLRQEVAPGPLRVLFLSRAFPPVIGGIEAQNYALSEALGQVCQVQTLANRRGKRALPIFLPWVLVRSLLIAHRFDVVLLGDGVMAAVGWAIKRLHPALPVVCVVHGLDLTHRGSLYQWLWVRRFLPNLDHLVAVSRSTRAIAVAKGIAAERMSVIANGISPQPEGRRYGRHDLARLLGEPLGEGGILVTLGRLVRRKGVGWFIEQVVPRLPPATWYLVAGAGPEQRTIERALLALPAGHRVRLLGAVDEAQKTILLDAADLFVQPNVPVERDVEGFGIAVLEAGLRGLPVIASALEGLVDAVVEGENGWLVPPGDAQGFADVIGQRLSDRDALRASGERGRRYVRDRFSWRTIVAQYASLLTRLAQQGT